MSKPALFPVKLCRFYVPTYSVRVEKTKAMLLSKLHSALSNATMTAPCSLEKNCSIRVVNQLSESLCAYKYCDANDLQ